MNITVAAGLTREKACSALRSLRKPVVPHKKKALPSGRALHGPALLIDLKLTDNYFFSGAAGAAGYAGAGVCSCVAGAAGAGAGASSFFVQPKATVMAKAETMMSARIFFIMFHPLPSQME